MEKLDQYRSILRTLFQSYSTHKPSYGEIDTYVLIDESQNHYQLLFLGWNKPYRIHAIVIHARLHNGKIWIEYDGSAHGIATDLVAAGIPKDDIVLAFLSIEKRPDTDFAVE